MTKLSNINISEFLTDDEIKQEVRRIAFDTIEEVVSKQANKLAEEMTTEIIENELRNRYEKLLKSPVTINSGWGSCKTYDSLDGLFKQKLEESLKSYEVQREAERMVKTIVEAEVNKNVQALKDNLLKITSESSLIKENK